MYNLFLAVKDPSIYKVRDNLKAVGYYIFVAVPILGRVNKFPVVNKKIQFGLHFGIHCGGDGEGGGRGGVWLLTACTLY